MKNLFYFLNLKITTLPLRAHSMIRAMIRERPGHYFADSVKATQSYQTVHLGNVFKMLIRIIIYYYHYYVIKYAAY